MRLFCSDVVRVDSEQIPDCIGMEIRSEVPARFVYLSDDCFAPSLDLLL